MNKLVNEIVDWIKNDSFLKEETLELYLIGNQDQSSEVNDCDFVAFIEDNCSIIDYTERCVGFILSKSIESNLLINIFPYPSKSKLQNSSMFLRNVLKNGRKLL